MPASLEGVLAKIGRAKSHLEHLRREAEPIEDACRRAVITEYDDELSQHVSRLTRVPEVPTLLTLILGDAVHNLRAALDHLAWQLVIAAGGQPTTGTVFPVKTAAPKPTGPGTPSLPDLSPSINVSVRQVLDKVQPYKRTNPSIHQLAILHALDVADKHRRLLIAAVGVKSAGWVGEGDPAFFFGGPYADGDVVCRFQGVEASSRNQFEPALVFKVGIEEPDARGWARMYGAAEFVERFPLAYIEEVVLPLFQQFF
jgi:hypothetical protein